MYITVAGKTDRNEVILIIAPSLTFLDDMVDLQLSWAKPATYAAAASTFYHHSVNEFGWYVTHSYVPQG
jgi:hypothetical protein